MYIYYSALGVRGGMVNRCLASALAPALLDGPHSCWVEYGPRLLVFREGLMMEGGLGSAPPPSAPTHYRPLISHHSGGPFVPLSGRIGPSSCGRTGH